MSNNKPEYIECSNGTKEWFINGKRHREDGPAVEYSNGTKEWFIDNKRHRENGPAIEYSNGSKQWFINGKQIFHKFIVIDLINNIQLFESFTEPEALDFERECFANMKCVWIERIKLE